MNLPGRLTPPKLHHHSVTYGTTGGRARNAPAGRGTSLALFMLSAFTLACQEYCPGGTGPLSNYCTGGLAVTCLPLEEGLNPDALAERFTYPWSAWECNGDIIVHEVDKDTRSYKVFSGEPPHDLVGVRLVPCWRQYGDVDAECLNTPRFQFACTPERDTGCVRSCDSGDPLPCPEGVE